MIDEKKLIEKIQARYDFWTNKSAKCIEDGNTFKADICNIMVTELDTILHLIDKQLKAEKWTPCTEKLPKPGVDVEITTDVRDKAIGYYADGFWWDSINGDYIDVIAWRELSDPWEGDSK